MRRTVLYVENDPETLLTVRVKKHVLGTPASADSVVYEEKDDSFYMAVARSKTDRFLYIMVQSTVSSETRYAAAGDPALAFKGKEAALLDYARKLTANVGSMEKSDIDTLRAAGCDDGEILEVNQVCAYFNYSNRLLNGLGGTTAGDGIGYDAEDADAGAKK